MEKKSSVGRTIVLCILTGLLGLSLSCASGSGGVSGNDQGSEPVNEQEAFEYKKAVVRCYKTGGTRVVKIMGELRCY